MVATLLAAPPPEIARAATRTVCSSECDFSTIQSAVSGSVDNDIIQVSPGTYVEAVNTGGKILAIESTGGAAVTTIQAPDSDTNIVTVNNGTLTLVGFTITGADMVSSANPGGVFVNNSGGTITVRDSVITNNSTQLGRGGGLGGFGTMTVINTVVSGNSASEGGGLWSSGSMTVTDSTITGNSATSGGGGIYNATFGNPTLQVIRTTVSNNTASRGGGIANESGTALVDRSTISGNTASQGAGVWVTGASVVTNDVQLRNSTVANNVGPGVQTSGAGDTPANAHVWYVTVAGNTTTGIQSGGAGTVILARTLVATNGTDCSGTIGMAAFNLIGVQGDGCTLQSASTNDIVGTPASPVDPRLAALADNGGPTATFALLPGSPAIDAADTPVGCAFPTDQRGVARPQGSACDIGAFETEDSTIPTALTVDISDLGGDAGFTSSLIPIDELNVGTFFGAAEGPSSTQLGAIQLGAIQLGAIQLGAIGLADAAGHMTIGSIIDAAAELAAVPTILDEITLVDVPVVGGWDSILAGTSLEGRPSYTVTLQQVIDEVTNLDVLRDLRIADSGLTASQLGAIQLGAIQLGAIQLGAIQLGAIQLGAIGNQLAALCTAGLDCAALGIDPANSNTFDGFSIMALTLMGVDLDFAQLGAIQLGAIDPSGTQLGAIQLGAIQLGAIQLGAIGANAATIGNTQLGAIQLGAIQLGAITLDAAQLGAIGGKPGLVAQLCASGLNCAELGLDPAGPFVGNELDDYSLLALGAMGADLLSTQLGAIQLGAIQLGAIGDLENTQLGAIQLGAIQLGAIDPANTQLGAIQLGAIQLGAIQLGAIDWTNPVFAQLGAIQLGAIQLGAIASSTQLGAIQLGAIQLGAITNPSAIISCGALAGGCSGNGSMTLLELQRLGLILSTATLADLAGAIDDVPLSDLLGSGFDIVALVGAATLLDLLPETTIADLPPDLTLGQLAELWVGMPVFELLLALLNPGELSWEDVDPAVLAAQHPATTPWSVEFTMAGEPGLVPGAEFPFSAEASVNLPAGVSYVAGSSKVSVAGVAAPLLGDPEQTGNTLKWIVDGVTLNSSRTITFDLATAFTADTGTPVSTTVNTLGFTASDNAPTIVLDVEPNDTFATATEVVGDVIVLGRANTPGDVDLYKLDVPAGGTVEAYLNPGGTDLDLVLFEEVRATDGELRGPVERIVDGSLDPTIGIDPVEQDQESLADIANTDIAPVFKASLHRSTANERIVTPPLRNGGTFYLQTTAYNGASSDDVYVERIRVISPPGSSPCLPRNLDFTGATPGSLPTVPAAAETIYLMNTELFANTFGTVARDEVLTAISVISSPEGVVVPVEGDPAIAGLYDAWLGAGGNCSVDAANDVATAIAELVDGYRTSNPNISSVVIVGGDDQIPFFRVNDQGVVANEREYRSTFTGNNPLVASLSAGMVLTDAPYTDANPLYVPEGDREVFIPQLPTGRLVDQPAEIVAALNQYVVSDGLLDTALASPQAQVLGYDFLADSSATIASDLANQVPPFDVTSTISETWTKADLITAMDSGSAIVNGNAHFDHTASLPAAGNLSNTFTDLYTIADLQTDTTISSVYAGTIIFSMGCHAGLNAPDSYLAAGDPALEWAQSLLNRRAVFVGNTGFGYGDSDFSAYSEDLMALFAESIGTSNTIGEAFVAAQQTLAGKTAKWSPYHDKSQMEATLYGLPFYQLHASPVVFPPNPVIGTVPVGTTGLESASVVAVASLTQESATDGDYLVADDVLAVPFRPVQPLEFIRVTPDTSGIHATGAIIEGGSSTDLLNFDVLYARPILYNELAEPETETTGAFPNALQAVTSHETPSGRVDQLVVSRGRYFPSSRIQQRWDSMDLTVYYAPDSIVDITPPVISRVSAVEVTSNNVSFEVEASDDSGIERVVVLYKVAGNSGAWTKLELTQSAGLWSAGVNGLSAAQNIDFFVQVLGGDGQVSVSTNKAELHQVQPPGPPTIQVTSGLLGNNGIYKTQVEIALGGPTNAPSTALEYSVNGGLAFQDYSSGSQIPLSDGTTVVVARPKGAPTSSVTQSFTVDSVEPLISVSGPPQDFVAEFGSTVPLKYFCTDGGSGIANCQGTVGNGQSLDTSVVGPHVAQVTATDRAGNTSKTLVPYTVVPESPLILTSNQSLVAVGTSVGFTAEYTTTSTADDLHMIVWDFGDGGAATQVETTSSGTATISHPYVGTGVYPVTVTVTHPAYDGHEAYVQSETLRYIVVYDPTAGFVTGSGWIDSPSGAYTPDDPEDPDIVGRADFGFVSKYKKGDQVPTGNTTFEFAAGNLDFHSTSYDSLVVAGNKAQYKGVGLVDGYEGAFKFRLTARDADIGNTDGFAKDGFRIQIWQTLPSGVDWVLYDNGLGVDPATYGGTTELGGGSIVIHVPKGK
jgi:hypothetical protein